MEMTFIQCDSEEEVARQLDKLKAGFVTSDNRIYSEIAICYTTDKRSDRVYLRREEIQTYIKKLGAFK